MSKSESELFSQKSEFSLPQAGNCFAFITNYIIIGTRKGSLFLFDSISNKIYKETHERIGNIIECICTISNQEFSIGCSNLIHIYNISLQCIKTLNAHKGTITSLKHSKSTLYSSSSDSNIIKWNLSDSTSSNLYSTNYPIITMDLSIEGNLIAASDTDLNLILFSVQNNSLREKIDNSSKGKIFCLKFIKKDEFLISGDNESCIIIRKIKNFNEIFKEFRAHQSRVKDICFSNTKSLIVSCGFDRKVCFIDSNKFEIKKCFEEGDWVRAVEFNQNDSKVISIADDGKIRFYESGTEKFDKELKIDVKFNLGSNLIMMVLIGVWMGLGFEYSSIFIMLMSFDMVFAVFICVMSWSHVEEENIWVKIFSCLNLGFVLAAGLTLIICNEFR